MEIILRDRLAEQYSEVVELIESIREACPKRANAELSKRAGEIRKSVFTSPGIIIDFPSYLVVGIGEKIVFKKAHYDCRDYPDGVYPAWSEIFKNTMISEDILPQINELMKSSELKERVQEAIFLLFCYRYKKRVSLDSFEATCGDSRDVQKLIEKEDGDEDDEES